MDPSQLIALVTSLASATAAVLAWIAKIRWADEYSKAKDETIKAKDMLIEVKEAQLQTLIINKNEIIKVKEEQIGVLEKQVKSLSELTPMKIREYFLSVREQMEEYNNLLKKELDDARNELESKSQEISNLKQEGEKNISEIEKLEEERQHIAEAANTLENQLSELRQRYERQKEIFAEMPKINVQMYEGIGDSLKKLTDVMSKSYAEDLSKISKAILQSSKIEQQVQETVKQLLAMQFVYEKTPPWRLPAETKLLKEEIEESKQEDIDE